MPHKARTFTDLPNTEQAAALLAELATAPCPFTPVAADQPLALYGAGKLGRLARDYLKAVDHDFVMVVDRNAQQMANDPAWSGVSLLHPDEVPQADAGRVRIAVSIVTSPYVPIEGALLELGFKDVVPFYDLAENFRQLHPLSNGWFAGPLSTQDQANTAKVLAHWHDDVSRAHHLQFLAWRRLREEWMFTRAPVSNADRFFIPEVGDVLNGHESLADAGAHHGGVTETFVAQTKGAFDEIAAIEPDPVNRALLAERLQALSPDDARIKLFDCALGYEAGEAPFHAGLDYASQLARTGQIRVEVRPFDEFGLEPTFVKLHLEGAELFALQGARQTLTKNRPIVAATVYHNADGIWRTPLWLMETLPDYRFLFRAHSWCGTGAVVYAIPNERVELE